MMAIDEVAERIENKMFRQRHPHGQSARLDRQPAPGYSIGKPEDRAVGCMEREPRASPAGATRHGLTEQRDVGVVAAKEALVERLQQTPDGRRARSRKRSSLYAAVRRGHQGQDCDNGVPTTLADVPEGDALARAARRLQALVGERLEAEAPHPRAAVKRVAERLDGRRLLSVEAVGKNLVLRFEDGVVLRSHLRMSGRWSLRPRDSRRERIGRPWLVLRGAEQEAVLWNGPILELDERAVKRLGPDILAELPHFDAIAMNLRRNPGRAVGDALLDQRLVAGIGNLWKAEALWEARVSPWRLMADVSHEELRAVLQAAHELMSASAKTGRERRSVYGRAGHACRRCGTPIRSRGQGDDNRTAYWCPSCQVGEEPRRA
jgi:endonuclease-8